MKSEMKEVTCVRVYRTTRDKLAKLGDKDQTFDHIVNGLIEKTTGESYESK